MRIGAFVDTGFCMMDGQTAPPVYRFIQFLFINLMHITYIMHVASAVTLLGNSVLSRKFLIFILLYGSSLNT